MRDFLFSFHGRIGRARFWVYIALAVPFAMLLMLCFWAYALSIPGAYENGGPTPLPHDPVGIICAIAWGLALLATFIAGLAVTVKRLHDRNKAWWWLVVFVFVPDLLNVYVFSQAATLGGANVSGVAQLCSLAGFALSLWAFVELGCLRGTSGDNRFGPDPLAP
ncbi:MAG TPA: DUF805 domain-containing protein [Rhizomicrobium sp.]